MLMHKTYLTDGTRALPSYQHHHQLREKSVSCNQTATSFQSFSLAYQLSWWLRRQASCRQALVSTLQTYCLICSFLALRLCDSATMRERRLGGAQALKSCGGVGYDDCDLLPSCSPVLEL